MKKGRSAYHRTFNPEIGTKIKNANLEKILESIWDEHDHRRTAKVNDEDGSATKNESSRNFLRREVYALGLCLLKSSASPQSVVRLVEKIRASPTTRPEALSNTFHALLMCVWDTDQAISRQERSLMAMELEYAHRHRTPPELLCGFLYQSTDRKKLGVKLREGFVEPAFQQVICLDQS